MITVKTLHFLHFLFLDKRHLEIMFGDLFDTKESFLTLKICTLDIRIFGYFPKGLIHDFGQKKAFFKFSVLGQKFKAFKNLSFR